MNMRRLTRVGGDGESNEATVAAEMVINMLCHVNAL